MFKLILLTFFFPLSLLANFAEYFGSGASTTMVGNQSNGATNNPENHLFAPSLLAKNEKISLSFSTYYAKHKFHSIDNIVIRNETNAPSGTLEYGSLDPTPEHLVYHAASLSLPLANSHGAVSLTLLSSIDPVIEANSGDPRLPEYVLYNSRYRRPHIQLTYANTFFKDYSFAAGFFVGFKAGANIHTKNSLNGTGYGSDASMTTEMSPVPGLILGLSRFFEESSLSLTYNQEMKSTFRARASGFTNEPSIPFDMTINAMIYYNPQIVRLSYMKNFCKAELYSTLEWQDWSNYETPTIKISKNSGSIISSSDFESVKGKSILVPKMGATYKTTSSNSLSFGGSYRPSPLKGDFSNAGNSVDTDTYTLSGGVTQKLSFSFAEFDLLAGYEYLHLMDKVITKTASQEDGSSGFKIGAPSYKIGGAIHALFMGIKMDY